MKHILVFLSFMLLLSQAEAGGQKMGYVYYFTDGITISRDQVPMEIDHGMKLFSGDRICLEPGALLYIENCMGISNELIILSGRDKTDLIVWINQSLYDTADREKIGHCLIKKNFIQASRGFLGLDLRGKAETGEYESAVKQLKDMRRHRPDMAPIADLELLTVYLKYNRIVQAQNIHKRLFEKHPESGYLKAVDSYLHRVKNPNQYQTQ